MEDAVAARERGYHGYKIHHAVPDVNRAAEVCERIREGGRRRDGPGLRQRLRVRFPGGACTWAGPLDELDFAWYEDPVDPTDMVSLAELSRRLETPIAMSDRPEFRLSQAPIAIEQKAARILIGESVQGRYNRHQEAGDPLRGPSPYGFPSTTGATPF